MDPITIAMALGQFAPSIIKLVTGSDKAEQVAGKVVDIAKAVAGKDNGDDALEAIKADPNKLLEFRQAFAAQEADLEKAYLADIGNARAMQIAALAQDDTFSKRFVYYFAIGWSLFAMAYFSAVTFMAIPANGQRAADTILGVLIGTVLVGIFHYLYGSTRGSQSKTDLLVQAVRRS